MPERPVPYAQRAIIVQMRKEKWQLQNLQLKGKIPRVGGMLALPLGSL
jgi:hypothetical protein